MAIEDTAIQEFIASIKPQEYETVNRSSAVVSHVDNEGVVWVNVAGSVIETPTASISSEVSAGDEVTVEWRSNKLFIVGNTSNPSAGGIRVTNVEVAAQVANELAVDASNSANIARTAAESAVASATEAAEAAESAQESATNASEYASRALGNLSTVQSVTETLNWITAHGTMTLTTDQALDPTHVYFVVDQNGDYVVGGTHYSVVTEPDVADISTYYELSIDESLNNYVGTHLAVTSEGLWLLPDAGGNKVLIATGQGSTYTSAGTYIIGKVNNVDTVLASFLADGAQIGGTDKAHIEMDYRSFKMKDKDGSTYVYLSDLRDASGEYDSMTETFMGYGYQTTFNLLSKAANTSYTVKLNDTEVTSGITKTTTSFTFSTAPSGTITVTYVADDVNIKAYTLGIRGSGTVGPMSFAEGYNNVASGYASHAEGLGSTASGGQGSHAEGYNTISSGYGSHAEGKSTVARSGAAHAEGYDTVAGGNWGLLGYIDASHAEGQGTQATGSFGAHAEGYSTVASAAESHAEGDKSIASGGASHAQNRGTIASKNAQTSLGTYNIEDTATTTTHPNGDAYYGQYAVILGNGTDDSNRSNALTVDWSGNVNASGSVTVEDHSSPIGTIKTAYLPSDRSVANNTYVSLCSISLDRGVWVITGGARWNTNANGSRDTNISTTSGNTAMQSTVQPNSNNWTQTNLTRIVSVSADGTPYHLNARQTSGGALTAGAGETNGGTYITAVRIA